MPVIDIAWALHAARGLDWRCQCVEEIVDSCLRRNDILGRSNRIAPTVLSRGSRLRKNYAVRTEGPSQKISAEGGGATSFIFDMDKAYP